MTDQFDEFRKSMGADVVNTFLANFGMGPKYISKNPKKYTCPTCKKPNATIKELHPDTDINEIVLSCPDCGFEGN